MDYTTISRLKQTPSLTIIVGMENYQQNNVKYGIVLKNLIKSAKIELQKEYSDRDIQTILSNLDNIESNFIPSLKSESIVFFISEGFNEQVKVPFVLESEYQISDRFITKKLLRAANANTHYYVLTLGPDESRLLEYHNDQLIKEIKDSHFPLKNKGYWTSDRILNSMGSVRTNYQKEFYKVIDSELQSYINSVPHPIILAGVSENVSIYKLIANRNDLIVGEINGNFTSDKGESTHVIGEKSYEVIRKHVKNKKQSLLESLQIFNSKGRLEQDIAEIYTAAINGYAQELIVANDYYKEALILNGQVILENVDRNNDDYVEDIVNEIIYQVMRYGGEVIFAEEELLQEYEPLVLKKRF